MADEDPPGPVYGWISLHVEATVTHPDGTTDPVQQEGDR